MIARLNILFDYRATTSAEWPALLDAHFKGICAQFASALDRFHEVRDFESDIIDKELQSIDPNVVADLTMSAEASLRDEILDGIVAVNVPDGLARTLTRLENVGEDGLPVTITEETRRKNAADQIGSLSNIGKQISVQTDEAEIARVIFEGQREYAQTLKDEYLTASREVAKEDAKKLARAANRTALGAATGKSVFGRLKQIAPKIFRWMED